MSEMRQHGDNIHAPAEVALWSDLKTRFCRMVQMPDWPLAPQVALLLMSRDDDTKPCDCDDSIAEACGLLFVVGVLTMIFTSSWQMFAAAAALCIGALVVSIWRARR